MNNVLPAQKALVHLAKTVPQILILLHQAVSVNNALTVHPLQEDLLPVFSRVSMPLKKVTYILQFQPVSCHFISWGDKQMDEQTDKQTEKVPILQDFFPYRGRYPKNCAM